MNLVDMLKFQRGVWNILTLKEQRFCLLAQNNNDPLFTRESFNSV